LDTTLGKPNQRVQAANSSIMSKGCEMLEVLRNKPALLCGERICYRNSSVHGSMSAAVCDVNVRRFIFLIFNLKNNYMNIGRWNDNRVAKKWRSAPGIVPKSRTI